MTSIGHEHAIIHPSGVQNPMNGASPTLWPSRCAVDPAKAPAQGVRDAGVALVERMLGNSTVRDLVSISDDDWHVACRRFDAT
jgi:hypothetical protein